MNVLVRYSLPSMTLEQYEEATLRIQAVGGEWPPSGLEYHCCFHSNGDLQVIEVWSSRAQLRQYGQWLRPLLEHVGIDLDEVDVFDVHRVVKP